MALLDGLADERGPIPTFAPLRTGEHRRIVIDDEEEAARREAVIRRLPPSKTSPTRPTPMRSGTRSSADWGRHTQ